MSDVFCDTMFCSLFDMIHSFSETLVTTCQTRWHQSQMVDRMSQTKLVHVLFIYKM